MRRYYAIQKILALWLIISMSLTILAGCAKEEQNPAGTVSDFESQAHFQPGTSGDDPVSGDTSKAPLSGGFVVSEKKYDYKDGNIELLYVENETDRHYDITIHGAYLDENGETIKEETQTFAGFASGRSNNFIFYPRMAFDSFTYTVEAEEATGEIEIDGIPVKIFDKEGNPLVSYIEFVYNKNLVWQRGMGADLEHPGTWLDRRFLMLDSEMRNSHQSVTIQCEFFVLILDSDGEVFLTSHDYFDYQDMVGGNQYGVQPVGSVPEDANFLIPVWSQEVGEDETLPDNVKGVFTAIFAVTKVYDWDDWMSKQ